MHAGSRGIMRLMISVVMACSLSAAGLPIPPRADALAVPVNLHFDSTITSEALAHIAREEAAALWVPYGVRLEWTACDGADALCLDATVERSPRRGNGGASPWVLGKSTISEDRIVPRSIHIAFDAVEAVVEGRSGATRLHEHAVGVALGRVLAHELGHVLLGSPGTTIAPV